MPYYIIETELTLNATGLPSEHYYTIETEPGRGNLSGEIITSGWLGTTNDWAQYAHGGYVTENEAKGILARLIGTDDLSNHVIDDDDDDGIRYSALRTDWEDWDADEWCYADAVNRVTAAMTDEQLIEYAEELEAGAESDRVRLHGDILKFLHQMREEKRDELLEEISEGVWSIMPTLERVEDNLTKLLDKVADADQREAIVQALVSLKGTVLDLHDAIV